MIPTGRWQEWLNRVLIVLTLLLSCTGGKLGMAVGPAFVIAVAKYVEGKRRYNQDTA